MLIGNGLDNKSTEPLFETYSIKEVDKFLIHLPLKIGLNKEDIELGVRFKNSRIELYYTLKKDKKIEFQNKVVYFNKGDQILVAISYRYDKHDFMAYLKMYFSDAELFVSKDNSYSLVLCKK